MVSGPRGSFPPLCVSSKAQRLSEDASHLPRCVPLQSQRLCNDCRDPRGPAPKSLQNPSTHEGDGRCTRWQPGPPGDDAVTPRVTGSPCTHLPLASASPAPLRCVEGVEDTLPPGFCHQAPPPPHTPSTLSTYCPTQVALKEPCCVLLLFVVLPFCKRSKTVRNGAQKRMACWPHTLPPGPHGQNRAASRHKTGVTICYTQNSS